MKSTHFTESTTSGSVATVATPIGKTQTRGKGIYPNEKGGNLLTGKKTNKKFPNTVKESQQQGVAEGSKETKVGIEAHGVRGVNSNKWKKTFKSQEAFEKWLDQNEGDVEVSGTREVNLNDMFKESMKEAKLDEEDVIIVPGQGNRIKPGFIPKNKDRTDHEVEMAKSDLFQSNKNAKKIYELIKDIPESVGIEGWVQEKIIKANDYLNTVREYLEHKQISEMTGGVIAGGGVGEGLADDFASMAKSMGMNAKIRLPGEKQPVKPAFKATPPSPEERIKLQQQLEQLKREINKLRQDKDESFSSRERWSGLLSQYDSISKRLKMESVEQGMAEGEETKLADLTKISSDKLYKFIYVHKNAGNTAAAERGRKELERRGIKTKDMAEGYRILPNIDRERYQEREGLEGPFRARNGKVYYYDPKAGMAYDPDTDFYIDYDTLTMMDKDEDLTMEDNTKPAKQQSVDRIIKDTIMTDQISKDREGHYIFRKGYYYRPSSMDPTSWAQSISKRLQEVGINNTVVDSGDIWKPFKGGASVKAQSHYYAKIKVDNTMAEGIVGKVLGGAALLAALWGIGQNEANKVYSNSPQLQTLIKYHQMATQQNDQAKIQELERRIENHKTRLSLGKGEVMGSDDKPIVPSFESSIMKGIQNEANKIPDKCPKCNGKLVAESELNEEGNKDACYHKVKSRYKVWPSAYASGALVKCRKVGASNWGNKSK